MTRSTSLPLTGGESSQPSTPVMTEHSPPAWSPVLSQTPPKMIGMSPPGAPGPGSTGPPSSA
jgi:hypothetical protein